MDRTTASPAPSRLVASPVFVISAVRSGSTLLRCVLDTHSRICAPHELHLPDFQVQLDTLQANVSMEAMGLDLAEAEHLLWDRLLHRLLAASGKHTIVDKTPANALRWQRLAQCWPQARFIFLVRHPSHVLDSMLAAAKGALGQELKERFGEQNERWGNPDSAQTMLLPQLSGVIQARAALPGLTVRYEELTADPARVTQDVCRFLGLEWESEMMEYGRVDHGPFKVFLGDNSERIHSGRIQASRELPAGDSVPPRLREACQSLGYLAH
ncbi:sulfotransferase [Lysobacter enzymogenes]|uniref:sulfotransferase family protein n=1 Tax=Lysobacter enzymogenes TaxID=69 RepID=UPI003749D32D